MQPKARVFAMENNNSIRSKPGPNPDWSEEIKDYKAVSNWNLKTTTNNWVLWLAAIFLILFIAEIIPTFIDFQRFDMFLYVALVSLIFSALFVAVWHSLNIEMVKHYNLEGNRRSIYDYYNNFGLEQDEK